LFQPGRRVPPVAERAPLRREHGERDHREQVDQPRRANETGLCEHPAGEQAIAYYEQQGPGRENTADEKQRKPAHGERAPCDYERWQHDHRSRHAAVLGRARATGRLYACEDVRNNDEKRELLGRSG
jgi:hypothetical protein